ncbi:MULTISPECIES: pirin family protein [Niastella]|uniref:Pirin family protein n=1 Tax=Niastella soli TaxID=2821487 RepID=A0ABS3Z2C8_9BACT|nr:pirin family protein [Niastella soli]MBO9203907.1 pirin family protein [Niastella soli]
MKKKIIFTSQGHRADIGEYKINRILPNRYADAVGPFVFLDHLMPASHSPNAPIKEVDGTGAHPHRGIATLTYIINGEADHHDSAGHHAKVRSGGAQWMKAGNGIIHDEAVNVDVEANDLLTHAMQFWINLPASQKATRPDYLPVQAGDMPKHILPANAGWLKVIAGEYENLVSKIPSYTKQLLYHLHLNAGGHFTIDTNKDWEYAAFLPLQGAVVNNEEFTGGDFLLFDNEQAAIEISNMGQSATDLILFGGEPYTEPIVSYGPFVMNTQQEIATAYRDFHAGKYGIINYQ